MIVCDARGLPLDVLHQSIQVIARIRDADHTNSGTVPQTAGVKFGNRNVETGAQAVFQATQDLSLILERLRRFDVQFEGEEGDHESVASGQLPVAVKPLAHRALVLLATNHSPLATLLRHCFRGNSLGGEGFDRIADFDVPVVGDGDAALHAVGDLAGIVFEAA